MINGTLILKFAKNNTKQYNPAINPRRNLIQISQSYDEYTYNGNVKPQNVLAYKYLFLGGKPCIRMNQDLVITA